MKTPTPKGSESWSAKCSCGQWIHSHEHRKNWDKLIQTSTFLQLVWGIMFTIPKLTLRYKRLLNTDYLARDWRNQTHFFDRLSELSTVRKKIKQEIFNRLKN